MNRKIAIISVVAIAAVIAVSATILIIQQNPEDKSINYTIDIDDVKTASDDTGDRYISPFTKKSEISTKNAELFLSKATADDDLDMDGISTVQNCLDALKSMGGNDFPNFVLKYIQDNFEYTSDSELYNEREWAAYPVETLDKKAGDCEDLSILLIALLHRAGYDCGITVFSSITVDGNKIPSHAVAMVAVDGIQDDERIDSERYSKFSCEYNGRAYYAFETTNPDCSSGYTFREYVDYANNLQSSYTFMTIHEYLEQIKD